MKAAATELLGRASALFVHSVPFQIDGS